MTILDFFRTIRRDYRRWQNRRARAKRWVKTWPASDKRDWQGYWEQRERPSILRRQAF